MDILKSDFHNTLFDHIISDLWSIIENYHITNMSFVIGSIHKKYAGYRLITKCDLQDEITITSLINCYNYHHGLLSIDNFNGCYICGNKIDLLINNLPIRINNCIHPDEPLSIQAGSMIIFSNFEYVINTDDNRYHILETFTFDNINHITTKKRREEANDVGLFMKL